MIFGPPFPVYGPAPIIYPLFRKNKGRKEKKHVDQRSVFSFRSVTSVPFSSAPKISTVADI